MSSLFYNCKMLNNINTLAYWNISNVTNMDGIFSECSSLTNVDALLNWNTSNVTDMSGMFGGCSNLTTLDLSRWYDDTGSGDSDPVKGNSYNYIDLLLFNYLYNDFVVGELKVGESNKNHLGQIMIYMNYIDKHARKSNQDKTIGIIISRKDNKYLIEYSSDSRIKLTTCKLV